MVFVVKRSYGLFVKLLKMLPTQLVTKVKSNKSKPLNAVKVKEQEIKAKGRVLRTILI